MHLGVVPGVLEAGLESKNDRFQSVPCNVVRPEALGQPLQIYLIINEGSAMKLLMVGLYEAG